MLRRISLYLLCIPALFLTGPTCGESGLDPLIISLTLNGVSDDLNDLLVVPPSGFVINATFSANGEVVIPTDVTLMAIPWNTLEPIALSSDVVIGPAGSFAVVPGSLALAEGSYTLVALASTPDAMGNSTYEFGVRDYVGNEAPIGLTQTIWLDFESDRDATPGPDFPVDLHSFGLGSPLDPVLSAELQTRVFDMIMARVGDAYDADPAGIGVDPVDVAFVAANPGPIGDVTQICVGGQAPGAPALVGSVLIDQNNANRNSVECATIPPTGIFPRGLLAYSGNSQFQLVFDPLMTTRGGTPVGEHALDAVVLDPGFDPGSATNEELDRYDDIVAGIEAFGGALASVVAHETGHALGLVAPGKPGVGLHGGSTGNNTSHNVTSDGTSVPATAYLMNAGNTFSFNELAGIAGEPIAAFRPLNYAYLRDRIVQDPDVLELLPGPIVESIAPTTLPSGGTLITVSGANFTGYPELTITNFTNTFALFGEVLVSSTEISAFVLNTSFPAGTYFLVVENGDGQVVVHTEVPLDVTN